MKESYIILHPENYTRKQAYELYIIGKITSLQYQEFVSDQALYDNGADINDGQKIYISE